jgi:hypothetical protein
MAAVLLDESIKEYRTLTGVKDACRLCSALRIKHAKLNCCLVGADADERLYSLAFAPLVGPGAYALISDFVDRSSANGAALLANCLALGSRAVPQTHQPALHARLKCIGLAAVLMADDRLLSDEVVSKLAEKVRTAPGWLKLDTTGLYELGEEDDIGEYVYDEDDICRNILRRRQAAKSSAEYVAPTSQARDPVLAASPEKASDAAATEVATPRVSQGVSPSANDGSGPSPDDPPRVMTLRHTLSIPRPAPILSF